ncbi:coat protein [Black pepper virus E]|nr:coat protein [Black pepper virus E]
MATRKRSNARRVGRNAPRRRRAAPQPIMVVPAPRRPGRRRRPNGGEGELRPYHLFGLKGNDKGYLTFGPSGQTPSLGSGTLLACGEYKITSLRVQWKAQAASTAAGSMAIQIGLGSSLTAVDSRAISFKLTNSGSRNFSATEIGGNGRMLATKSASSTGEDQFRLAYAGNGDTNVAGDLLCFFRLVTRMPK